MLGGANKMAIAKIASRILKKSKKKEAKKKTVLGGAQTLAGKALINPYTLGGGAIYGVGRSSGKASEKRKVNKLNEQLRRRGVRV